MEHIHLSNNTILRNILQGPKQSGLHRAVIERQRFLIHGDSGVSPLESTVCLVGKTSLNILQLHMLLITLQEWANYGLQVHVGVMYTIF